MRAALLVAAGLVRQQRWPLVVLLLWVAGTSAITLIGGSQVSSDDALFFFRQQGGYAVAFALIVTTSALHNERRSRRILGVLSKGIERYQYLGGLLLGACASVAAYCLAMALAGLFVFEKAHLPTAMVWPVAASVMAACLLTASVAQFYSTFMSPFFGMAATAVTLALPAALAQVMGAFWTNVLPVYGLMAMVLGEQDLTLQHAWLLIALAVAQGVLLFSAAAWVFSRRDIAVAVE